jgi:hypothetical protein
MKTLLILVLLFFVFNIAASAQVTSEKNKSFILLSLQLNDGTKLKGFMVSDFKNEIQLTDFNLGNIIISKDKISDFDSLRIKNEVLLETINRFTYFGKLISINNKTLTLNNSTLSNFEIELNQIDKITPADGDARLMSLQNPLELFKNSAAGGLPSGVTVTPIGR